MGSFMKFYLGISFLFLFQVACTPMKRAQTGIARAVGGQDTVYVNGHEVYCSQGRVCSEIDVLRIYVENRDKGKVRITFKNRTGNNSLFQVRLEILDPNTREVLAESRLENVALPATQEKNYEMPGIYRKNALVRVLMNKAY